MRVNERMKKLLSIALTMCMVLAYVPSPAGATGTGNHTHDGSYVAPENPECTCAEKCEEANVWCDVCRVDHTKCLGQDTAGLYFNDFECGEDHLVLDGVDNKDGTHTGICEMCHQEVTVLCQYYSTGYDATHHWDECNYCGAVCQDGGIYGEHELDTDGYCYICEYQCEHTNCTDGVCDNCGMVCDHNFDSTGKCDGCGAQAEAKVGDTVYPTFAEALNYWTEGTTLTLLGDVSYTGIPSLTDNGMKLHLNGYTLTLNGFNSNIPRIEVGISDPHGVDAGSLDIVGPGRINGTIECRESTVTMENVTVNSNYNALDIIGESAVTINDCTLQGGQFGIENGGSVTLNGTNTVTARDKDAYVLGAAIQNYGTVTINGTLTLTGGSRGEIQLSSDANVVLNTQPNGIWRMNKEGGGTVAVPGQGITLDVASFASATPGYKVSKAENGSIELVACDHADGEASYEYVSKYSHNKTYSCCSAKNEYLDHDFSNGTCVCGAACLYFHSDLTTIWGGDYIYVRYVGEEYEYDLMESVENEYAVLRYVYHSAEQLNIYFENDYGYKTESCPIPEGKNCFRATGLDENDNITGFWYSYPCSHSFKDGICILCKTECEHEWDEDLVCKHCGMVHTHEFNKGFCRVCETTCEHKDTLDEYGFCTVCDMREIFVVTDGWSECEIYYEYIMGTPLGEGVFRFMIRENAEEFHFAYFEEYDSYSTVNLTLPEAGYNCYYVGEEISYDGWGSYKYDGKWAWYPCEHSWQDGECAKCGTKCGHSWEDGVCTECGKECDHPFYWDGKCYFCGKECEHTSYQNGKCSLCFRACPEHQLDEYGFCTVCDMRKIYVVSGDWSHCIAVYDDNRVSMETVADDVFWAMLPEEEESVYFFYSMQDCGEYTYDLTLPAKEYNCYYVGACESIVDDNYYYGGQWGTYPCTHAFENEVCTICGADCTHDHYTDGKCDSCGHECPHDSYVAGKCEVCGCECTHVDYENGFCTVCDGYEPATLVTAENSAELGLGADYIGYYAIGNAGQLYWFADKVDTENDTYGSAKVVLAADITVNEGEITASSTGVRVWNPIGDKTNIFNGTFDGNGKTVSGLYYNNSENNYVGLFARVSERGVVKNVTVTKSYFCGYYHVAGIVGLNEGTVTDCVNRAMMDCEGYSGGIVGNNQGNISNCLNYGTIHGSGNQGGIVGCNRGTVEFCGNEGSISTGWMHAGGIVGDNTGTVRNCWNTGDVYAKTNCAGGIAGSNIKYSGNTVPVVENCWSTGSVTPVEKSAVGGIVGRSKDSSQNNCYSVMKPVGQIQDENGVSTVENMEAKTLEQFASGEVAYLLGGVWGQDLDNGKTVQTVPSFDGADVYYGYFNCGSTEATYTNTVASAEPVEHDYENGFCEQTPDETHYEPATLVTAENCAELGLSDAYIGYYAITNAGNLYWFADKVDNDNANFGAVNVVLTDNITVNTGSITANSTGARVWNPIGWFTNTPDDQAAFSGTFDGNGKSISGLYFNNIAIDGVSLFATTGETALVKNVTVTNSYFCGNYNNSAVVAINYGTVSSCFNEATLIGYAQIGGIVGRNLGLVELCGNTGAITGEMGYVGGIVGDNKSTVRNCWNTGNIQVDLNYVGGITGANNSSGTDGTAALTENCWSTGTVVSFGRTSAGGIVGAAWVNLGGVRNCYSLMKPVGLIRNAHPVTNAEQKTLDQFASGEVAYLLRTRAAEGTDVWGQNIDNGQTVQTVPALNGADVYQIPVDCMGTLGYSNTNITEVPDHSYDDNGFCANTNNGVVCDAYEPATLVTAENCAELGLSDAYIGYYAITNAGNLYWFADKVDNDNANFGSVNVVLTDNITVNTGTMDANTTGARVWNPIGWYNSSSDNAVFSGIFDGNGKTVSGLYYNNSADTSNYIGLVACVAEGGTVKHVTLSDSYILGYQFVGSIAGINYGTVTGCVNNAAIGGDGCQGGIAGENHGTVELCGNTGTITNTWCYSGGIVGRSYGIIRNCWNTGSFRGDTKYAGGIVGTQSVMPDLDSLTENCWSMGQMADMRCGGIAGWLKGPVTVRNCYSDEGTLVGETSNHAGSPTMTNVQYKSTAAFASGEVAYLLGGVWGQDLDNGKTVQTVPTFDGAPVYYGYTSCADTQRKYTNNADASDTPVSHEWGYTATGAQIVDTCVNGCGADGGKVALTLDGSAVYDGTEKTVKVDGSLTGIDTLPAVTYEGDRINAGTFTAYLTLEDGTKAQLKVTITAKEITPTIEGVRSTYSYNGEAIKPAVTVKDGDKVLTEGTDYDVTYGENIDTETDGFVKVTLKGNYEGEAEETFTINPKPITVKADAVSKIYGETDPELTYQVEGLVNGDQMSGELKRVEGENVGTYAIEQNTLTAGNNYIITYTGANFTIRKADPAVTAPAANDRVYDGTVQELLFAGSATGGTMVYSMLENGTYGSIPVAENAGTYTVWYMVKGDSNHNDTAPQSVTVTIAKAPVAVLGTDMTVTYNGQDIDLRQMFSIDENAGAVDYTIVDLTGNGTFTGAPYLYQIIKAGTFTVKVTTEETANYLSGSATAVLTVNKAAGSGTVTMEGWTYGENANAPVASGTGAVTYRYSTEDGKVPTNAGTYTVTAIFGATDLYEEATATAEFTIAKKSIQVTADAKSKTYGDADPALTYTVNGLVGEDQMTGELKRVANENVGTYTIEQNTLTAGDNYTIFYTGANFTINPKPITVKADAVSKIYGETDPTLTYTVNGLVGEDQMTGELKRVEGENIGTYAIEQNTLTAGNNYTITYTGAELTINPKPVTADDVKLNGSLVYTGGEQTQPITVTEGITYEVSGNKATEAGTYELTVKGTGNYTGEVKLSWSIKVADSVVETAPDANELTYTGKDQDLVTAGTAIGGKLVYSLSEDGEYTETIPTGKNAGEYTVWYYVIGDVNHGDSAKATVKVEIDKAVLTITSGNSTITYGDAPTAHGVIGSGFVNGESFADLDGRMTLSIDYEQYGDVGIYTITHGGWTSENYEITYVSGTMTVNPKPITVKADAVSKIYGETDPELTYQIEGLVNGDQMSGELKRVAGENVGAYAIEQNTLTAGNNYTITYTGAEFTVNKRAVTVTAKDQTIVYGTEISGAEYTAAGLVEGHTATATLTPSTEKVTANGTITAGTAVITADGTDVTANYEITYTDGKLVIQPDTSKIDGLTTENVTSANEADIKAVQEMLENADSIAEEWNTISETCKELMARIEEVRAENARIEAAVSAYDVETVKSSDEEAITQLISDIDAQLATGNLTAEERTALEEMKAKCNELLAKIAEVAELIAQLDKTVADMDEETVKSTDKETLEQVIEDAQKLIDSGNVTDEEKETLKKIQEEAKALIQVIDDIAAAIKEAAEKAESYDEDSVNSADKAELKKLAEDIEALLDTENLTEEERAALEKLLEQVKEMISIIDKTAAAIKAAKDLIDARDPETVTSEDKDELERAIDIIEGLLNGNHLTYNERNGLADAKAEAEEMLDAIEAAQKATETENTGKVEEVTSENVKPEDKEALEAAKEDLEKALEENGSNYTEEEKQAIREEIQRIEEAIKALENVETVVDGIAQLPETVEPDDEATAEKILASKAAYEALTDHEKSLVDEAVKSKLDQLLASLSAYDIIEGDEGQWTKGSGEGLGFVANGPLSKFVGIVVDEIELDKASFETKSGSTVITLIDAYLESLTVGEHTITVVYTDGETSGTFTVLPKAAPTCNILLWIIVIVCLAVVVIVLVVIKKRRSVK